MPESPPLPASWTALAWITICALAGVAIALGALYRATMERQAREQAAQLEAKAKRIAELEAAAALREERHSASLSALAERHQGVQASWMERMHGGLAMAQDAVERVGEYLKDLSRRLP